MISKQHAQIVHKDLLAAVDAVCKAHGLTRVKSSLSYGAMFDLRLQLQVAGGPTKEEVTYNRYAPFLRLPPLHTKFNHGSFEVMGLRVGGPYKSLIYKNLANSKLYKMSVQDALQTYPDLKI